MTDEEAKNYLKTSGYMTIRKRMLASCSLKEFLQLMETKVHPNQDMPGSDELEFVDEFLKILEEELPDVRSLYAYPHLVWEQSRTDDYRVWGLPAIRRRQEERWRAEARWRPSGGEDRRSLEMSWLINLIINF